MIRPTAPTASVHSADRTKAIVDWWYQGLPRGTHTVPYLESDGKVLTAQQVRSEVQRQTPLGKGFLSFLEGHYKRRPHVYHVLRDGEKVESPIPGVYGGYRKDKIYGRLDCKSGMRMLSQNRVFFQTLQDAHDAGYRACKNCQPDHGPYCGCDC